MSLCTDPRLTYLNKQGYNVILLPREGIEPLDILGRENGTISRLGTMEEIWNSPTPAPNPGAPHPAAGVSGTKTNKMDLSIGLNLLGNILAGMGAVLNLPKLTVEFKRAHSVQYTFGDVIAVSVDPFAIGNYMATGNLDAKNPFVERYFEEEDTSAFVLSEVLKSDSITVASTDANGTDVSLDLPAIQQIVGAKVGVSWAGSGSTALTFKGSAQLTFGFKAFGILYADGKWAIHGTKPDGSMAFAMVQGEELNPILLGTNRLLRLAPPAKEWKLAA